MVAAALFLANAILGTPEYARLDCGLRVVVLENHTLPLVSVQLWFGAGTALEPPAAPGATAALLDALEERDATAVRLAALGVRTARVVLPDAAGFDATLPPALLEPTLAAVISRLRPLDRGTLTAAGGAEVGALQEAVHAPAAASAGLPVWATPGDRAVRRRVLAALFADHPYAAAGRDPAAAARSTHADTPEALREFASRWFVPGNATLVVIGDVIPPQVMHLVRRKATGLQWAEPPRRPETRWPRRESLELPVPSDTEADGWAVAWLTPGLGQAENVALMVLMERLCNPVDGPLFRRLAAAGFAPPRWEHEAWRDAGVLLLLVERAREASADSASRSATTAPQPARPRIAQIIAEELARAAVEPPDPIELDRARALAARRWTAARATFAARARDLGMREVVGGDMLTAEWEAARARTLPVGALQEAARTLGVGRRVIAPRLRRDAEAAAEQAAAPRQLCGAAALAMFREAVEDPSLPRLAPPSGVRVETRSVGSRVQVTIAEVPGLPETIVRTLVDSPVYLRDGLTALMLTGSSGRSGAQWRDYCTYRGIELVPLTERHRQGLDGAGTAADVERLIEAQALLLRHPERSPEAVARAYERLRDWFDAPSTPAERRAGHRPLPPDAIGWQPPAYFSPLSRWEVAEKLGQLDAITAVQVIVVGDVDAALAAAAVEAAWDDWSPAKGLTADRAAPAAARAADGDGAAPTSRAAALPVTTLWVTDPTDAPLLVVQDTLASTGPRDAADADRLDLALHAAARLAAAPIGAARITPRVAVRWVADVEPRAALTFMTTPGEDPAGAARALADRLGAVRAGACAPEEVAAAVRLARVDRWLALDGAGAIAGALEQGRTRPWSDEWACEADAWAARIAAAYAATARYVSGVGATDAAAELRGLESSGATCGSGPGIPR